MRRVEVVIEVSRRSFVKRTPKGRVAFVSPWPSPFNYGSVVGTRAPDGDPLDAIVLGPRLARGTRLIVPVVAEFRFLDAGIDDPKLICSALPFGRRERAAVERFFRRYAIAKGLVGRLRGAPGPTRALGFIE